MYKLKENDILFGNKGRVINEELYNFLPQESKDKFQSNNNKFALTFMDGTAPAINLANLQELHQHPGYITSEVLDTIAFNISNGNFNHSHWNDDQIDYMISVGIIDIDQDGELIY